jgi:hypothetical protein
MSAVPDVTRWRGLWRSVSGGLLVVLLAASSAGAADRAATHPDPKTALHHQHTQLLAFEHQLRELEQRVAANPTDPAIRHELQQALLLFDEFYRSSNAMLEELNHLIEQVAHQVGHSQLPTIATPPREHRPASGALGSADVTYVHALATGIQQQHTAFQTLALDASGGFQSAQLPSKDQKLQSEISQTSDAAVQQTDLATTLLQQLSSLLQVILR